MNRRKIISLTITLLSMSLFLQQTASAHEPIFGLGPHTLYQFGYAFGFEFEKGERGWAHHLELIYGLTPDWAATIVAPYQFGENGQAAGFGDMTLRTKYRFYRKDMRGASSQAALHAGIKFPTGDTGKRLGSGATDFFVGASFGFESRRHYIFTGSRYHRNGTYSGLDRGDVARFNLAYGIRPWKLEYLQPDPVFILEINGRIAGKNRLDDRAVEKSGGSVLSFGPGLLFSFRNVMLKAGVSIPVLEKLNNDLQKAVTEYVLAIEMHLPPLR